MIKEKNFPDEFKSLSKLALPIILGGAVNAIMPFMNTVYLARLGETSLAGGGLALSLFVFMMTLFWGLFGTMSAFIARYRGAGEDHKIGELVRTALVSVFGFSLVIISVYQLIYHFLEWLHYPAEIITSVHQFFIAMSFATPADLLLTSLYALCFGLSRPRYVMIVTLFQVPINLFLNHAFMFGDFGLPALGVAGIGAGVATTYWIVLIALLTILSYTPTFREYLWGSRQLNWSEFFGLLKVGGPAGLQWVFEIGFFSAAALMIGKLDIIALAAYQVVFQIYSLFFNLVYNFNQAVTIRVAEGIGNKRLSQIKYSYAGAYVFIGLTLFVIIIMILFVHKPLIHLFMNQADATGPFFEFCRIFLFFMPLFALFDFMGYLHFETLRAFKDSAFSMCIVFVIYWVIGVPSIYSFIKLGFLQNPLYVGLLLVLFNLFSLIGQSLRYRYQYLRVKRELTTSRSS